VSTSQYARSSLAPRWYGADIPPAETPSTVGWAFFPFFFFFPEIWGPTRATIAKQEIRSEDERHGPATAFFRILGVGAVCVEIKHVATGTAPGAGFCAWSVFSSSCFCREPTSG